MDLQRNGKKRSYGLTFFPNSCSALLLSCSRQHHTASQKYGQISDNNCVRLYHNRVYQSGAYISNDLLHGFLTDAEGGSVFCMIGVGCWIIVWVSDILPQFILCSAIEQCETLPQYGAYQSGAYISNGLLHGFLIDAEGMVCCVVLYDRCWVLDYCLGICIGVCICIFKFCLTFLQFILSFILE